MNVEALRRSFIAAASDDAERAIAECQSECNARLAEAQRKGDDMVARARDAGESDSKGEVAQTLVAARREAHARKLAAQREVYEEFCRAALAASFELRGTPRYEALVKRLAEAARRQLGQEARLEIDPPTQGGVVGQAGSRRVDYTLAALTAGCISDLGERIGRLWE